MTHCHDCLTFAGRFQKANRCCQIRLLMEAPKHVRMATYARVKKEDGEGAYAALRLAVHAEYVRKMEYKTNKDKK